jgi:hypothetical protein
VTTRTAIIAGLVSFVLVPAAQAQAPQQAGGLVPPRAVMGIVHSNGLDPVGRPMREGATYVVRAINRRGLLMRVVVDARSGQIRAVNRIVPGPDGPGAVAMRPAPYGPPPEFDPPAVGHATGARDTAARCACATACDRFRHAAPAASAACQCCR